MANFPKEIKIGCNRYKVVKNNAVYKKLSRKLGLLFLGKIDNEKLNIIINPNLAYDVKAESLLHEVMHGALDFVGIYDHSNAKIKVETLIRCLAPILLDTLRKNPELTDYLLNK